jgi:hypothetical protein
MAQKQDEKRAEQQARQREHAQPLFVKLGTTPPAKKP